MSWPIKATRASDITSGRFWFGRMPDMHEGKVMVGQGKGKDPKEVALSHIFKGGK